MKPQTIGRVLGIGLRVAGRIAGQQMAGGGRSAATSASTPRQPITIDAEKTRAAGRVAGLASRGFARGVGGFLRPFSRVGGTLWLEVSGVFFLLPVIVFTPNLWHMRASILHGPDHRSFLVTAGVVAVFLYLGVTSFWRAHKRGKAGGNT